jgi:hypothetical protein
MKCTFADGTHIADGKFDTACGKNSQQCMNCKLADPNGACIDNQCVILPATDKPVKITLNWLEFNSNYDPTDENVYMKVCVGGKFTEINGVQFCAGKEHKTNMAKYLPGVSGKQYFNSVFNSTLPVAVKDVVKHFEVRVMEEAYYFPPDELVCGTDVEMAAHEMGKTWIIKCKKFSTLGWILGNSELVAELSVTFGQP